jgi:hypothetical protein
MAPWQTWVQALAAAAMLAVVPVRAVVSGSHFQHYTDWNWALTAVHLLVDLGAWRDVALLLQPLTLAVNTYVALAASVMMGYEYGVVAEAYRDYPRGTVEVANFALHTLPWCLSVATVMLRWAERNRRHWAWLWRQWTGPVPVVQYAAAVLGLAYTFSVLYLYTQSPDASYGLRKLSNRDARLYSAVLHPFLAAVAVGACVSAAATTQRKRQ